MPASRYRRKKNASTARTGIMAGSSVPDGARPERAGRARRGAIVLAGGQSRRMGRDKASLVVDGAAMLDRVLRALAGVVDVCVVAAAPDQLLPALAPGVLLVRDHEAHRGPLVALEQAMGALPADVRHAFVCGSDLPWLAPAVVERMFELSTS